MKPIIAALTAVVILAGCGGDKPETTPDNNAVLWHLIPDHVRFDICKRYLDTGKTLDGIGVDAAYQAAQCS